MKLTGKTAIITGGGQGFGKVIAEAYLKAGANIALCGRTMEVLLNAKTELQKYAQNQLQILIDVVDVTNPTSLSNFVETTYKTFGGIDILVANAGVYGTKGAIEEIDWQVWSDAIDINLKGVVLSCINVLPHFKKNKKGKIIILSGGGATKPMPYLSAYAASKAAVVRFAETLAHEVTEFHIDVNTIAPGALNTRLLDEILEAGPEKVGKEFYQQSLKQKDTGGSPLEKGAELCVFLASDESDGITGRLISAIWDPWKTFTDHKEAIKNSDVYTLRRIVPSERGMSWGDVE